MKPSYTQPSTASQIAPLRHWETGGALNASRSKGISLFSTRKSALHCFTFGWVLIREGKLSIRRVSERKITRCYMLRKTELLRL